jgi:hypothetical protein
MDLGFQYPQSSSEVADYKVIAAYRKFSANNAWSPGLMILQTHRDGI